MNCFHFSVSLGYKTTEILKIPKDKALWIAFIFQYLWDTKQPLTIFATVLFGCELLSFFSIFGIQNNRFRRRQRLCNVVNCFHFSVSLGYKTTGSAFFCNSLKLWIAFIFQYLWDTKQLFYHLFTTSVCCELLSFFSIFGIQNNNQTALDFEDEVVNCFHFSVSLGYKTT